MLQRLLIRLLHILWRCILDDTPKRTGRQKIFNLIIARAEVVALLPLHHSRYALFILDWFDHIALIFHPVETWERANIEFLPFFFNSKEKYSWLPTLVAADVLVDDVFVIVIKVGFDVVVGRPYTSTTQL